ncbi:MAG: hypothetical protein KBT10_02740 [Bacteroidales bacterium]|nr:hypothetical protein [Candidatus Sodaliphilus aphodohippi]
MFRYFRTKPSARARSLMFLMRRSRLGCNGLVLSDGTIGDIAASMPGGIGEMH